MKTRQADQFDAPSTAPLAHADQAPQKKVLVKTFGCQMNVYDSERMTEALAAVGYAATEELENADLVVLNTCHIREKASEKVYSDLGRIRQVKDQRRSQGKEMLVTVAGCVAQAEGKEIAARAPVVDLVVGPQSYHQLPALLQRLKSGERRIVETEFPEDDKFAYLPERQQQRNSAARAVTAFLTVQEGCDKFCTFCVVPYTRGAEYSRPVADLVREAEKLVERGVAEITLLGQNVNAYHGLGPDGRVWSLARLLSRLAKIEGLERLRYTTSHPGDMSGDLIAAHRDIEKLMPYLHLPFQAGSDRILAAMNRKHTVSAYREIIAKVRAARSDLALSTDIIVGFPGETEEDFAGTLRLVEDLQFAQAYSFKYSARPGTPAAGMPEAVPEAVKTERLNRLQELLEAQQRSFNQSFVGKTVPVLVDRADNATGLLAGRSPYLQLVRTQGPADKLGTIVRVEIAEALLNSMNGVMAPA